MDVNKYFVINSEDFIHIILFSLKPLLNTLIYIYSEQQDTESEYGFL